MPNITPLVLLANRPLEIRGTGLIDGQHRSEIFRLLRAAAVDGSSDPDQGDQDASSSGVPDPKPSGPR